MAAAAGVAEGFASIETEGNQAKAELWPEDEKYDEGDPAHHAHRFTDGGNALSATELALGCVGGTLIGLDD